jgi:hypothetical protein
MSTSQFADAITSLNQGEGVPCTITVLAGKKVPEPSYTNKRVLFDKEFEHQMAKITSDTNKFYSEIGRILAKPNIGKGDREAIMEQIRLLRQELDKNVPFIKTQFTEQMDQTVTEAKGEFESFMDNKIRTMGLEGFKKELMAVRQASLEDKSGQG